MKGQVKALLRRFGYQVLRLPGDSVYERVMPEATYSPWNGDLDFAAVYEAIRSHTLVDKYRCWELWTLVSETAKVEGAILEVGVWRGGTGALMAKRAAMDGNATPVFLCDTFTGVVKAGHQDTTYRGGEHADTSLSTVVELLRSLEVGDARILQGIFPEDTASVIDPSTRFRLCHIDVDVYTSARDIMIWLWPRLSPGGVVVYDDYGFQECDGIRTFVHEQAREQDRLVLHNLNGHAVVVKLHGAAVDPTAGERPDIQASPIGAVNAPF